MAGSSKCPHEPNTYAREQVSKYPIRLSNIILTAVFFQPQITLLRQPASSVFPSEAAVFKVLLLNAANELGQYEL